MNNDRSNIKSFRFSDDVLKAIESFSGTSTNDKFNNLVLFCYNTIPARQKELERIKKDIAEESTKYNEICKKLREVDELIRTLNQLKYYGELCARKAELISTGEVSETYTESKKKFIQEHHNNGIDEDIEEDLDEDSDDDEEFDDDM